MSLETNRYWGYRIDTSRIDYFQKELHEDRLRQGWGSDPGQDLRKFGTADFVDAGASKNRRIYEQVKKGHILLVPRLPHWERVAIVEAAEDFDVGYRFGVDEDLEDYGHRFPAKMLGSFTRSSEVVHADIRTTLRYRGRFWNLDVYREHIQRILSSNETARTKPRTTTDGLKSAVEQAFNALRTKLFDQLSSENEGKEWEAILVEVFRGIYPDYLVEHFGDESSESEHGTDILISVPGIDGYGEHEYAIAVQVKDHDSLTEKAIKQIQAAPEYWKKARDFRFVDKCVVLTKDESGQSKHVDAGDTKVIRADELSKIIEEYARRATLMGRGEHPSE